MNPDPDATELFVERVRVTGRRPIVSAVIVGAAVVSLIGLAILKPWVPPPDLRADGVSTSGSTIAPSFGNAAPSRAPTSATPRPIVQATPLPFLPRAAELLGTAARHDDWGIRAVVVPAVTMRFDVNGPVLAERWMSIDVAHGAAWNLAREGAAESSGDAVLAIGATTPAEVTPLGVRFWRLDDVSGPREIEPVLLQSPDQQTQLWLPDPANSTRIGTWPPGSYRIDVTDGERVVRLVIIVRGEPSADRPSN